MFLKAKERYNIDMAASLAVGDKERDVEAALSAGVGKCYLYTHEDDAITKGIAVKKLTDIKF